MIEPIQRREFLSGAAGLLLAAGCPTLRADEPAGRIKIGQIGTKHAHAAGKMATMRKLSAQFEVVGVVEPDPEQRRAVEQAEPYRGLEWLTEEQLFATAGLRAVAVETEVRALIATAARCVAAGCHVHLDKPAGTNVEDFRRLWEQAERRGLCIQMGYMFRYNPAFRFLFEALKNGWLGSVFSVDAVMSKTVGRRERDALAKYPGGAMFELGCHVIDAVVGVLGKPRRVVPFNLSTRPAEDDLRDNGLAVFEYPTATATVRSAVVELGGGERRQFVVCGDQGTVEIRPIEPPRVRLVLDRRQGPFAAGTHEVPLPPMTGRYDDEFLELARILRGESKPKYTAEHDVAVQETLLLASG